MKGNTAYRVTLIQSEGVGGEGLLPWKREAVFVLQIHFILEDRVVSVWEDWRPHTRVPEALGT